MAIFIQLLVALLPLILKLLGILKAAKPEDLAAMRPRQKLALQELMHACKEITSEGQRLGLEPVPFDEGN